MTNLAIIDKQQIFREGLHRLLEQEDNINVIVSETSFFYINKETLDQVDLFLIDIDILLEESKLTEDELDNLNSNQKIVVLSTNNEKRNLLDTVKYGYHGYLLKEMSYNSFILAIRSIIDGGLFIHPQLLRHLVDDYRRLINENESIGTGYYQSGAVDPTVCTKREHEILQLLVDGNDNNSIAKELNISEKTVKNHLTNIFRKLDVKDRTQAAVLAIRSNWVQL